MNAVKAELPREQELRAKAEWPFAIGLVYLADLIVDDTYQRPPHHQFISEIASNFDETLVGCIDVNRRSRFYAVLDGQQRLGAMRQVGKTTCYAAIYEGLSIADEAGFFYRKNKDRKTMNAYYAFRARIVAGDQEATAIQHAVEAQGYVLSSATNEREAIGAIRAVEQVWGMASEKRDESLTPTLVTLHESVFGRKDSLASWLILGVGRFWQAFGDNEVQRDVLTKVIGTFGPTSLVGMARERQAVSSTTGKKGASQPWTLARILVEEYNRDLRGSRRGASFEGRLDVGRLT